MTGLQIDTGSLRLRFLLAVMLWVALGVGGIWFTATRVFERHIERMYHQELEVHLRELVRLTRLDEQGRPGLQRPLSDPRFEMPLSGFYWQVSVSGSPPMVSESMTRGRLDRTVSRSSRIVHSINRGPTGPAISYGLIGTVPTGEEIRFVVATDQSELDDDIASFTNELVVWLAGLAMLLVATGLAIISFGLRPLTRLGEAIGRLRSAQAPQLEGRYPSEITPLVTDLNIYVRRNTEIVSRARVQAGNLAHSLRTPLAILTDEAERMARLKDCAGSSEVLLGQISAMQQQIDYQLARAQSAAGARVPGSRAVLPDLALPILNAMRRLHPGKRFRFEAMDEPVSLSIDPVNLSELLSILLDNAGKWARDEVRMTVELAPPGQVTIAIGDDGPGMPEGLIAKSFEIGSRFDPAMPGTGLGLAMARDIAQDIGAQLSLHSGSSGLTAVIRLPVHALGPDGA